MNKVALIFDWDLTLAPYYMQRPIFEHYKVDETKFWGEVHRITRENIENSKGMRCYCELAYLQLMLEYASKGIFKNLDTNLLAQKGKLITPYPLVLNFLNSLKTKYSNIEFFIISSGILSLLKEHEVTKYIPVENIYASDFADVEIEGKGQKAKRIGRITSLVTPWDKPRIMEEIVKGSRAGKYDFFAPVQDVIPRKNIFYIGDGISDIFAFQKAKEFGGYAIGLLTDKNYKNIECIRQLNVLDMVCQPDYSEAGLLYTWIDNKIQEINQNEEAKFNEFSANYLKL